MELSWIQTYVLVRLLRVQTAPMKTLIPTDVPANQFSYHLKGLIAKGLVSKESRGVYSLTVEGQKIASTFSTSSNSVVKDVKTVILFYAKKKDQYLLFRWSRQPYLGQVTLPHDRVGFEKSLDDSVVDAAKDKLGQQVPCTYQTTILIKIYSGSVLVSSMTALVFAADISEVSLPLSSRNGEAFLGKLGEQFVVNGLESLIEAIESNSPLSEVRLTY